jgi:hypothetical protein
MKHSIKTKVKRLMNFKLVLFTIPLLFAINTSYSQKPIFEYGKITAKDMDLEKYREKYPNAAAVIIGDIGECKFNLETVDRVHARFQYVFTRTTRIMILNESGLNYGSIMIPYYEGDNAKMVITNFRANVHNINKNKVSSTRIRQRAGRVVAYESQLRSLNFDLPDIKPGSVLEYRYTIVSDFYRRLPEWKFQSVIPVEHSEYNLDLPAFFNYRLRYRGFEELSVNTQRAYTESLRYKKTSDVYGTSIDAGDVVVNVTGTRYRWVAKNMPPIIAEPYIDNINNYISAISFELLTMDVTQYDHNTVVTHYANTWDEVADALNGNQDFGGFIIQASTALRKKINLESNEELWDNINTAYDVIKKNVKWNNTYSVTARRTPEEVLKNGRGNSAEVNLLLCVILQELGISANPVVLSTIDNVKLTESPTFSELNYVIVAVTGNSGEQIFLDATEALLPAGYLPIRALNEKGVLIHSNRAQLIDLKNPKSKSTVKNYTFKLKESGDFEGHFEHQYLDYYSYLASIGYNKKGDEYFLAQLKKHSGVRISEFEINLPKIKGEPFVVKGIVKLSGAIDDVEGKLQFKPLLLETMEKHPFMAETRRFPIEFFVTQTEEVNITIEIPENIRINSLPAPHTVLWGRNFKYDYKISEEDNTISLSTNLELMESNIPADRHNGIVDFFNRIVRKNSESIILERK